MRKIFIICLLTSVVLSAEPSVYGNAESYGNTQKNVKINQDSVVQLREENSELRQELEGLKSIVEGLSIAVYDLRQKQSSSGFSAGNNDGRILRDLTKMIDKIDKNYVTRAELKKVLKSGKLTKASKSRPKKDTVLKRDIKKPNNSLEKADSAALYSRGVRLVKQKKYSMAELRFSILRSRGYKKASTLFYSGEVSYRTGRYSKAIEYYKLSVNANERANYMDTLLLHAGLSLEKRGDRGQSKRFFQAVVDGYPDSGSAKIAKRHL